jgi:hypothetical protein
MQNTYTTSTTPGTRTYTTTAPTQTVRTTAPVIRQSTATRTYAPTSTVRTSGATRTYTTGAPVTRTVGPTTTVRSSGAVNERRLDSNSARILAQKVFAKYDANGSGFMNSMETGQLISDLYSSLNVNHPANREEGLEFMNANDADSNQQISLRDFEDIFVQHLSTGSNNGFKLFLDSNTYATRNNSSGRVRATHGPTTTYQGSPRSSARGTRV